MPRDEFDWIGEQAGRRPRLAWSFTADAPLVELHVAREAGDVHAADESGGLYRLSRAGQLVRTSRGFRRIGQLAGSDVDGTPLLIGIGEQIRQITPDFETVWIRRFPSAVAAVAAESYGRLFAVALEHGGVFLLDADNCKVAAPASKRPLARLQFPAGSVEVVGTTRHGDVGWSDGGEFEWSGSSLVDIGDVTATFGGSQVWVAGFSRGVIGIDRRGASIASFAVAGTPSRVACTADGSRLAIATQERHLYWLDRSGRMLWATETADTVHRLAADPLGRWLICGFTTGRIIRIDWP